MKLEPWWGRHKRRIRRFISLLGAAGLVAVPTLWTLFPSWGKSLTGHERFGIAVAWGIGAAVVVWSADRQANQVDDAMGELERHRSDKRRSAGNLAIDFVLRSRSEELQPYQLDVYLPEGAPVVLRTKYSSLSVVRSFEWKPPAGATGYAFQSGSRVTARGEVARNDTYQLTPAQQAAAANLEIVVAMPILNLAQHPIGVLTVCAELDDGCLGTPEAGEELTGIAEVIARLLVDVCGLATDQVS